MLSINLYQYLRLKRFQGLSLNVIKKLAAQILQALRLIDRYRLSTAILSQKIFYLNQLQVHP